MDLRISKERKKHLIATGIIFVATISFLLGIGFLLYGILLRSRSKDYVELVGHLIDKATSTSAKIDPRVLEMLARAMVLHFQDIGITKKGIKIDTIVKEILNKNYADLLDGVTDKAYISGPRSTFPYSSRLGFSLVVVILFMAFVLACVKIHKAGNRRARNKFQKKLASILFISLAAITTIVGGIIFLCAKTQGITLTISNVLKLADKFDRILPDTINALHAHSGTLDPQHMKSLFVTYLNLSTKAYDQFSLAAGLFGVMAGCFMLSITLIFTSLISFLNSRGEVINNHDYEDYDYDEIALPPYQPHRSTENDPPSYQLVSFPHNNQSSNPSDEQAVQPDSALPLPVQPDSALPLPTQAPPDYDDPNYTSHTPNSQTDTSLPPYQQLDTITTNNVLTSIPTIVSSRL